ncbi:MAG: ABC transporter substrate-binding protein [Nocardioidaceae bacterium]|nr:ABC transporter substrate-binding protein [Nocardioidaceae bacterium]
MKRHLIRLCLALAVLLLLPACGSGGGGGGTGGGSEELTIAAAEQFDGFDSTSLAGTNIQAAVMRQLYDTLVALDADRKPQPRLAESWEQSPDHRTMTLHLRPGLKFSDGSPLTAQDVVWNVTHGQDEKTAATARPLFMAISKATAVDPATVQLTFPKPLAAPFDMLDYLFIAKPQDDPQKLKNSPVGSGPFKLEKWDAGTSATLTPNPSFWDAKSVKLKRVTFKFAGDLQAAQLLFRSKQADFLFDSTWKDFASFAKQSGVQTLMAGDGGRVEMFLLNAAKPPFDNADARRAFAAALDRGAITKTVYRGQTEAWCLPWPEGSVGYEASPDLARSCSADPARSRELLTKAGHADGLRFSILTVAGIDAEVSQVAQQQLAKAGLNAKIDSVEDTVFFDRAFAGDWQVLTSTVQRVAHDSATSIQLGVPLQNGGVSNFKSDEYQRLIDSVLYENPGSDRVADMRKLNEFLLDQAFFVPVTSQNPHYVFAKDVKGLQVTLDGYLILQNVSVG